ncbi:hypothetical protein DPSP01_014221 [Paraphaeosphaeria sporulosa]|uniref:Uncharacterized protein n=1 Tax=Paraphaeosphaeria sporulosa TaxID=1460663 RepID=A0A177BVT0_9PLEO|nr:uncharacterized protein CC84DRAFT_1264229 [Paraphaeosphaeria sporulosa]OAF99215.1 hypothetical protein CC84DRAFT_1264229 [Paraphaeosphaeria sporulosa]
MRFTLLPLLAAAALASSDSSAPASEESPKPADPTPAGEIWAAKWTDADLTSYTKHCASSSTLKAQIYTLGEMYPTLKEWAPQLKVFYNKQLYPGSWEGKDAHGEGRELLKMAYEELPFAVREWLTKNPKQRHFSVQDDIVFFAPGAIYPILPLFVEEPESDKISDCEGLYEDLENYSAEPKEGVVLGKVAHKTLGKNEVEITLNAFQIKGAAGSKDEL